MAPIEKLTSTPKKSESEIASFQIGKEAISAGMLSLDLQMGIADTLEKNSDELEIAQSNRLAGEKAKKILDYFVALGIKKEGIEDIKSSTKGILTVKYIGNNGIQEIIFDLLDDEHFILGNVEEFYGEQQKINAKIQDVYKGMDTITDAMHIVFMKNESELFDALDDTDDALTESTLNKYMEKGDSEERFAPFLDMNLRQLSEKFKELATTYEELKQSYRGGHPAYDDMLLTKEQYLDMTMGIGDEYEGGAEYLEFGSNELLKYLGEIVDGKTSDELMAYVRRVNIKIDQNNYQSTPVEQSYKIFSNSLNSLVFKRLEKNNANEAVFLEFVKIISGQDETYRPEWAGGEAGVDDNLKSDSENMIIMNDVILLLMTRKGGIMDKVNQSESGLYKLEDEKVGDKDTGKIVQDFRGLLKEKVPELMLEGLESTSIDMFIREIGYGDILDVKSGTEYEDLSFQQKAKISVLYRVVEKLEKNDDLWNNIYDNGLAFTSFKYSGEYHGKNETISKQQLRDIFVSVAVNANEELTEKMTETFQVHDNMGEWLWGKDAKDFGLVDPMDKEIFNFFKEFQGVGALDFSDRSIGNLKTTGKFVGVIGAAMVVLPVAAAAATAAGATTAATAIATMGAVGQGAVMGASASIASIAINPKGYDSIGEGVVDIATDIIVGTVTGAAGGLLVQKAGINYLVNTETGTRVQLTEQMKTLILNNGIDLKGLPISPAQLLEIGGLKNKAIFATDLSLLGIAPEGGRMWGIDTYYHNKESSE